MTIEPTEFVSELVEGYNLDGSDPDLNRLLSIATAMGQEACRAFREVGVGEGWRVVDCGCGPIGAVATLSEIVGASGQVVGVDFVDSTVNRAREVVARLGLDNVQIALGDVNKPNLAEQLGAPFDAAYMRCFLVHQRSASETLRKIATLLRPGGWVIAQEPMRVPPPGSFPPLDGDVFARYWELVHRTMEAGGADGQAVAGLASAARRAGFEVASMRGFFCFNEPALGFGIHAATLEAAKAKAIAARVAYEPDVDALATQLRNADADDYEWVASTLFMELVLRRGV